jgi:hypothetical protein
MKNVAVAPSTIDGIKRLAKQIKRAQNIPHHQALNFAAKQAGYENLRHAHHHLVPQIQSLHAAYLTAYWRENKVGGRETIKVLLPVALADLIRPHQLRHARHLGHFKLEAPDHLERVSDTQSLSRAVDELAGAARTLHFIAATGLRPVTTQKERNLTRAFHDLPGHDHSSEWISRDTGHWVYLNEPYAYGHGKADEWAKKRGFEVIKCNWKGLYFPDNALPTLFCSEPTLAANLNRQLDALAELGEQMTESETGSYAERYVSPARLASGRPPLRRAMPAIRGVVNAGSLPYGPRSGGNVSMWRPAVRMALPMHQKIGSLLAALASVPLPTLAYRRIQEVRSTLDDWIQMEYPSNEEMSAEEFGEAYYGHRKLPDVDERDAHLGAIENVINTLLTGYTDCRARREVLKKLGEARTAIEQHVPH